MTLTLSILEEVYEEVNGVVLFYEEKQENLGIRFFTVWEQCLETIVKSPLGFRKHHLDFRAIQLNPFPYIVIYELSENVIVVYRIIHVKKHPRKRFSKISKKRNRK